MDSEPSTTGPQVDELEQLAALEALAPVLDELESPGAELNLGLHLQHIELATKAQLEDQVETARLMMVRSLACGDGQLISRSSSRKSRRSG